MRKYMATGKQQEQRHAHFFTREILNLFNKYEVKIFGRIWVKGIGQGFDGIAVYTSSVQAILTNFQAYLQEKDSIGIVIGDSRSPSLNANVSHGIFTKKFRSAGDDFNRIVEIPTFGHSENIVGLQLTDYLVSALVAPMSIATYCEGHVENLHVRPAYKSEIKQRYKDEIKKLQFRYQQGSRTVGGLVVRDDISQLGAHLLFS